jgi:hypothetical protein
LAVAISSWVKMGFGSEEELEDHSCRLANGIRLFEAFGLPSLLLFIPRASGLHR